MIDLGRNWFGQTYASSICPGSGLLPSGVFVWAHWKSDGAKEFYDNYLNKRVL